MSLVRYPTVIPCTKFEHFGSFVFIVFILFLHNTLMRDIDIAILSVRPSVCPSVHNTLVLYENGLTYRHSFFHRTVAQSF